MRHRAVPLLLALAAVAAAACASNGSGSSATPGRPSGTITVFAAASLTDAFGAEAKAFEAAYPGTKVQFNFAGSPALRAQLDQGARADALATADVANMRQALDAGLVRDAGATFARNRLVVIVPRANPAHIASPADRARSGVKLVIAADGVPAGTYARQALDRMSGDPIHGADFAKRVERNVVSNEANVKGVVTKVQLGEADAGIVYETDVTPGIAGDVSRIEIPDAYNVVATYPIAMTKEAGNPVTAQAFIDFLLAEQGQALLERYGFMRGS